MSPAFCSAHSHRSVYKHKTKIRQKAPKIDHLAPLASLEAELQRMLSAVLQLTCSAASNFSFARWNSSNGFCTQMADNSTKCFVRAARAASRVFSVAW